MKVAALIHFYPPWRSAGSETVAHEMMKAAVAAGHEASVFCTHQDAQRMWRGTHPETVLDGVKVNRIGNPLMAAKAMARTRPDVVLTHHQHSVQAIRTAKQIGARSVFCLHNDMDLNERPLRAKPDLVIYNSEWVKESLARFGQPKDSVVMRPPLTPDRHAVPGTGDALTLCNVNEHKGARFFYALAERMPDRQFIAVVGGHGNQIVRRNLKNVKILEHGPDMKRVWSQTRILLMPSVYESYGLTAVEAGVNGIPTIANATPGLLENIGAGGSFVDWGARNLPLPYRGNEKAWHAEWANPSAEHLSNWVDLIGKVDSNYEQASDYARSRSVEAMDATRQSLNQWTDWLDAGV